MTQGLQARNDWGRDKVHSPGTQYTPHQGAMRETHVAKRKTLEAKEKRERKEGGCMSGWLKSCLLRKKACQHFNFATDCPLLLLLGFWLTKSTTNIC